MERTYVSEIDDPYTRLRVYLRTEQGAIVQFVLKLEYNVTQWEGGAEEEWQPVARIDHNQVDPWGHDLREEGLHLDLIQPDGTEVKTFKPFGPNDPRETPSVDEAFAEAKRFLELEANEIISEYEARLED